MRKSSLAVLCVLCIGVFALAYAFSEKKEALGENLSDDNLVMYENKNMGFKIGILEDMSVDNYLEGITAVISNDDISLSVFYDDFTNVANNYGGYIDYANKFLKDTKNHTVLEDKITEVDNKETHFLSYSRKKLSKLDNDKNYYCSAEIKVSNTKVYTLLAKTNSSDLTQVKSIINSFKVLDNVKEVKIPDGYFKKVELNKSDITESFYDEFFGDDAKLTWGIFDPEAPNSFDKLDEIEKRIGYNFKFLIRYQSFNTELPIDEINEATKRGKVIELTPQTMNTKNGEIDIYEILDGKYDEYLNKYAKSIKSLKTPILFRFDNEMNGDWCGYCAWYYGKDAELYREAWKYVYKIFEANEVDNALWVWNPNHKSFPDFSWNNALMYYPGDEYVDIVGLTAYNTGNYYSGEVWSSFDELYEKIYNEYARVFEKPLMITEFSSSIFGGDKVSWVKDMFKSLEKYSKIKVAIWWSHIDYDNDGNEARVYRIDRPEAVLDVFKEEIVK